MTDQSPGRQALMRLTTEIVSAHVAKNAVSTSDLPGTIESVFATLAGLGQPPAAEPARDPAVSVKKSVTDDHLVCLDCGRRLKMLKRHLATDHGMTVDEYRRKWGLPHDYPAVAPAYSRERQALAKTIGLGRKPAATPAPAPARGRRKKTAGA